jgi:hypothetical protein
MRPVIRTAAVLLILASAASAVLAQAPPTQFLEERIIAALTRARLRVTEDGKTGIHAGITDAAPRYKPERRAEAETNADKLAARIEYHARETGASDVTSAVVDAAFDDVCPLWPFCE